MVGIVLILLSAPLLAALIAGENYASFPCPTAVSSGGTLTDQDNRSIRLPNRIDRMIVTAFPIPALWYAMTGSCKEIVGIHPGAKDKARASLLGVLAPNLLTAADGFVKGQDLNIEEALKLEPDLFLFWGLYHRQLAQFDAIDIPTVSVHTVKGGNASETLEVWARLLGRISGDTETASKWIAYMRDTSAMISERVRDIPRDQRPRALILYYLGPEEIDIPGAGQYGQYWIESTGAVNAAENISGRVSVNMEQIYRWNPDIIYITNFSDAMPKDLTGNAINSRDWSGLKAVKEGRVYKIPMGIYGWYPPSPDAPLMLKWMAQKHHPALFGEFTMAEEIRKYYSKFYHYNLSPGEIEAILHLQGNTAGVRE
jgi:iron complex transport system substrate-binding protein